MPNSSDERSDRAPGGVIGAVFNVVVCGVLVVALPIIALTSGHDLVHIAFAVALALFGVGLLGTVGGGIGTVEGCQTNTEPNPWYVNENPEG